MVLVIFELPRELFSDSWEIVGGWMFLSTFLLVPALGIGVGWVKGFPRWAYPYVGQSVIFCLYVAVSSTPGIHFFGIPLFGRQGWSIRACFPLVIAILTAVLITRSKEPFLKLFTNAWADWTCITFGMFALMPLLVWISFDEVDHAYSLPYMVFTAIVIVVTAWFYMRSVNQAQRIWVLFFGILVVTAVAVVGPTLYWNQPGEISLGGMMVSGTIILVIMFSPGLIGLYQRRVDESTGG